MELGKLPVCWGPAVIELSTYALEVLRKDEDFVLYRGRSQGDGCPILVLSPVAEHPTSECLKRLEHECSFRGALDPAWSARPIALARDSDRIVLEFEDPGGVPLDQLLGNPLELALFLRLAVSLSAAIDHLHEHGIIHKDIKPANVLVDPVTGRCWLRGFGIASRLPRERQPSEPPEFLAGTLAYMAPEQTGRMNRCVDSPERSLRPRRHPLRNADRESSFHGLRSDGMGPLSHRETAGAAHRAA